MSVRVTGVGTVVANLKKKERDIHKATVRVVNEIAQDVFNESQRSVPVDTGNLKSSARIDAAE